MSDLLRRSTPAASPELLVAYFGLAEGEEAVTDPPRIWTSGDYVEKNPTERKTTTRILCWISTYPGRIEVRDAKSLGIRG